MEREKGESGISDFVKDSVKGSVRFLSRVGYEVIRLIETGVVLSLCTVVGLVAGVEGAAFLAGVPGDIIHGFPQLSRMGELALDMGSVVGIAAALMGTLAILDRFSPLKREKTDIGLNSI